MQVQRQETALILEMGDPLDFGVGAASLAEFAAFAVDENRVRPDGEDRFSHGDARPGEVEGRSGKSSFVAPLLVPGAIERAHPRADVHLVYRRIEANPRDTRGKRARIFGERAGISGFWKSPSQVGTPKWHRSTIGSGPWSCR